MSYYFQDGDEEWVDAYETKLYKEKDLIGNATNQVPLNFYRRISEDDYDVLKLASPILTDMIGFYPVRRNTSEDFNRYFFLWNGMGMIRIAVSHI